MGCCISQIGKDNGPSVAFNSDMNAEYSKLPQNIYIAEPSVQFRCALIGTSESGLSYF